MMRTSASHPLLIAELPVGAHGGGIGVTFAPGKYQEVAMTGAWARDLDVDVSAIQDWGATHLVTLLEPWELKDLRIESLPAIVAGKGISWHGLPITDGAAPDDRLLKDWLQLSAELVADMLSGQRIVVHCKGGGGTRGNGRCHAFAAVWRGQAGIGCHPHGAACQARRNRNDCSRGVPRVLGAEPSPGRSLTTQVRSQELKDELPVDPELEGFLGLDPEIDGVSIVDLREGSGHIKNSLPRKLRTLLSHESGSCAGAGPALSLTKAGQPPGTVLRRRDQ